VVKKLYLFGAAALVIVASVVLYFSLLPLEMPKVELPPAPDLGDVVGLSLTYRIRFACGHYLSHVPQDGEAGLLRYFGLAASDIVWEAGETITSATGTMRQGSVAGPCRDCLPRYFAGVKDGYVAIYYGSPRRDAILKQVTEVRFELLPKDFQISLERGIPISDDYALMLFLEGIDQ